MTSKRLPPSEAASTVLVPSVERGPMKRGQTSNVPEQRMRVRSPRHALNAEFKTFTARGKLAMADQPVSQA